MKVVVTGAASGIGAALCAQLETAGHAVIGLDIQHGKYVTHRIDLTDPASIIAIADKIVGPIHGLAHVAGLPGTRPPADIFAVNSLAPKRLTYALEGRLSDDASIVIVSSVTADRADADQARSILGGDVQEVDGKTAYELSKRAANIQMLRLLTEHQPKGRRVNTVSPGTVDTPILQDFVTSIGAEHMARAAAATGGHGDPADIAAVIAFMLSPASRWINGQVIKVDGGLHGMRAAKAELEMI
ncbi:MAG: SDR family oxidoreductase [Litorimonas sp.]